MTKQERLALIEALMWAFIDRKAQELEAELGGEETQVPRERNETKAKAGRAGKPKSNRTFNARCERRRKF